MKKREVWKLDFFVHCESWLNGGYTNTHYFPSKKSAMDYIKEDQNLSLVKLEKVTLKQFAEDYMGDY